MERPKKWNLEADVVILGYGAAGAAAAISAYDAGAGEILVLEKQAPHEPFGLPLSSSYMSGGAFICPNDSENAKRYLNTLYQVSEGLSWTDPEIIEAWTRYALENKDWVERMGIRTKLMRHGGEHKLDGWESIDVYGVIGMGPALVRVLDQQVRARRVSIRYETAAKRLIADENGEVIGVEAVCTKGGAENTVFIRAHRAVILATGGFGFHEEMKLQYLRVCPAYFTGTDAATGDGIRMAQELGAELWHMNCCSARIVIKIPPVAQGMTVMFGGQNTFSIAGPTAHAGYVMVDRDGKRFTNENYKSHSLYYELTGFDSQRVMFPRVPSYWVFDQARIEDGPLVTNKVGAAGAAMLYSWSKDNQKELENGWIKTGNTLPELADKLGLDPAALEATVSAYNKSCELGSDAEFHRPPQTLLPLCKPPFYAIEVWPGGPNTQGGPRRNRRAQVMRTDGTPIPRLFSAGELGSIYGMLYPASGGNIAECIAFGRIAGENASRYPSL